ncbi:hypothetical protein V5799_030490 [Amblyomma americanum]|uniref:M13 family peptidase n=1 Tax=Amblyomma americanum TaxID=6943 RepID=A0AAQ4EMY5_AMBAM
MSLDEDLVWTPIYRRRLRRSQLLCWSAPCQWTMSNVLHHAFMAEPPCDDFYAHVCNGRLAAGNFLIQMPTPVSAAVHLFADMEQVFKRYSSEKAAAGTAAGPNDNFFAQMMWVYNECRKAVAEDRTVTTDLDAIFEQLGLNAWTPQVPLSPLIGRADRHLRLHPLFTVAVKPSSSFLGRDRGGNRFFIHLGPPDTLYRRFMLSEVSASEEQFALIVHKALRLWTAGNTSTYVKEMLTSNATAEEVVALERELDELRMPPGSRNAASPGHSAVTLGDLPSSDSWSWSAYFYTLLAGAEKRVEDDTVILLSDTFPIQNLSLLTDSSWGTTIVNYMAFKVLVELSPFLGSYGEDLIKLTHPFKAKSLKHRQAACMVTLEKLYKYGVGIVAKLTGGRQYVTVHRSYQDKQLKKQFRTTRRMVKALLAAKRSWINAEAIKTARRKINALSFKFGTQSNLIEYEVYRNTHAFPLHSNWSTLAKVFKIHVHASTLYWDAYGSSSPGYDNRYTVSSYGSSYEYQEARNLLFLPQAVLSLVHGVSNTIQPIFYPIVTSHVVRGVIHTLAPAFWPTNSSAAEYKDIIGCLEDQYEVRHELSQLDFLDNAMIYPLYSMYRSALEKANASRILLMSGGLKYDERQIFFYVLASTMCDFANATDWERQRKFHITPGRWRVNVPLRNFRFFAQAFHCQKGTYMNPSKQCNAWKSPRSLFATNKQSN